MERLNPEKLHVTYLAGTTSKMPLSPRCYTLTHSDITGELFLSIGTHPDVKKISKLYTRLMRDEVLAELTDEEDGFILRVYCHVSGGFVLGRAKWRYNIFQSELPLVLETIRYGDRTFFERHTDLDQTPIHVHFHSTDNKYNKVEFWGVLVDYS